MDTPIKPAELATQAGISPSYAHMILSGARIPPVPLAVNIFNKTGLKLGLLKEATDQDIEALARVHGVAA